MRASIGFVPEDRRSQNIVPDFSIEENLLLAHLGAHRGFGRGYTPRRTAAAQLLDALDLPPHRWGYRHAGALRRHAAEDTHRALAADRTQGVDSDEPTKGVDIQTRQVIMPRRRLAEGARP